LEYQKSGSSDVSVSRITFGSWAAGGWMWGGTEQNDAVGARNPEQATQNARAIDVRLSFEEVDFINKQLAQVQLS